MSRSLTSRQYWDSSYQDRPPLEPIEAVGFRSRCTRQILDKTVGLIRNANTVLEIGGGASAWLAYFGLQYPEKKFVCVDYSLEGSERLGAFVERESVNNIEVIVEDFLSHSSASRQFDFVYSHGVVEHFTDLSEVLGAHASYMKDDGRMLTIIPNMAGILGTLTRYLNKDVYDIHVPHDRESLIQGHRGARLRVIDSGYLCSNNFGVLSSCVRKRSGAKWCAYKTLSRVSKGIWAFEDNVMELPTSKTFSPYIYVLSGHEADDECGDR